MNERIEHITKQVDEYFDDLSIEFSRQAWMEKFAELIVRECAGICEKDKKGFPNSDSVKQGLADIIKQHFGVEE